MELKLTNSDLVAIVDDEDFGRVNKYDWCLRIRHSNTIQIIRTSSPCTLANFVMENYENVYDHKDGNALDNRKTNLRPCTNQQNSCNRVKLKNCSSKYKGVSWYKSRKIWIARIKVNRITIFLGYFTDEEEAARAYDKAAKKYFKEFAKLNFSPCAHL